MLKRYLAYLNYLLLHKYFVYKAGKIIGVSTWQLLIHDWHKLLPAEFFAYAKTFYDDNGNKIPYKLSKQFKQAWNHHQKMGKHHWQYWVMVDDDGSIEALDMPKKFVNEMAADWAGAGRAITGKWDVDNWFKKNRNKMKLSHGTECHLSVALNKLRLNMEKLE